MNRPEILTHVCPDRYRQLFRIWADGADGQRLAGDRLVPVGPVDERIVETVLVEQTDDVDEWLVVAAERRTSHVVAKPVLAVIFVVDAALENDVAVLIDVAGVRDERF